MGRSEPSLKIKMVWFDRPTITPCFTARRAGSSPGRRLDSLMIRNTDGRDCPSASAMDQPVSISATGFKDVTRPSASTTKTASPVLGRVTCNSSRRRTGSSKLARDCRRALDRLTQPEQLYGFGMAIAHYCPGPVDRATSTMARPILPDELWAIIEPILPPLPPPNPKGGRPTVGNREALTGILFVLKAGIPWEDLPCEMGCGSGKTCWRRLRDWQADGVWDRVHRELLSRLRGSDKID